MALFSARVSSLWRNVIAAFSAIKRENGSGGKCGQDEIYAVDEWGRASSWVSDHTNSYNFDIVKEFICLGTVVNTNNDVSL